MVQDYTCQGHSEELSDGSTESPCSGCGLGDSVWDFTESEGLEGGKG